MYIENLAKQAKLASKNLARTGTKEKNKALEEICKRLTANKEFILAENKKDVAKAKEKGISPAMTDRLTLTAERIEQMAQGVRKIIDLDDPIGETLGAKTLPNGLKVSKVTVPMGVIGVIYESRQNVTIDTAALCLKASSAVILRGGSDAFNSNRAIVSVMKEALESAVYQSSAGDVILVLGKGHEEYIIDKNGRHPFPEREIIKNAVFNKFGTL